MRILGIRDHSVTELRDKLTKKFPDHTEDIELILTRLAESKIIDDERFATEYLHYLLHTNPKGVLALRQNLRKKGLTEDLISQALARVESQQESLAQEMAERKLRSLPNDLDPRKKQEKIYRFLVSKGFSFEVARKTLNAIVVEDAE